MVLCLKIWRVGRCQAKIMKIASSLKSLKKRDLNSKLVKRRGKLYVINKKNPKFKARQVMMSENDFKKTYSGFTKFVLGDYCSYCNISDIGTYVTLKSKIKKCWLVQLKKIQR